MAKNKLIIGDYNKLRVTERNGDECILSSAQGDIPLVRLGRTETQTGDILKVFVYTETDGALRATLSTPRATVGNFACMTVVDSNKFGVYLDWGIEKDLFVFHKNQIRPMKVGRTYVVYVSEDKLNGKIQGTTFLDNHFERDVSGLKKGEKASLLIYDITEIGIMAVINGRFSGMLYIDECFEKVRIGDTKQGYIKKVRDDGKIDLTLAPYIREAIANSKQIVLDRLKEAGGFLPFHDKSDPEKIKKTFSMSKKNFKKAIGGLYKEKKIHISGNGVRLV